MVRRRNGFLTRFKRQTGFTMRRFVNSSFTRVVKPELKYKNSTVATSNFTTYNTPTITHFFGEIRQGQTLSTRIGNEITVKSLQIHFTWGAAVNLQTVSASFPTVNVVFVLVPNYGAVSTPVLYGATYDTVKSLYITPTTGQLISYPFLNNGYMPDEARILRHYRIPLRYMVSGNTNAAVPADQEHIGYYWSGRRRWNFKFPKGLKVGYSADTGAIGDVKFNHILMYIYQDFYYDGVNPDAQFKYDWVCRYQDA